MATESSGSFDKYLTARKVENRDIDELIALSDIGYANSALSADRDQYESRLKIFPEGQYCIEYNGKIIGACSSLVINFEDYEQEHDYDEISDKGYISNHNPSGINLYGINVVVHPEYRHMMVGKHLYEIRRNICKKLNLKSIVIGGRIPNYHKYADKMTADEYVNQVKQQEIYDPVLNFQLRNGFIYKRILPDYLPEDHASLEYATLMEWYNPYYIPNQ